MGILKLLKTEIEKKIPELLEVSLTVRTDDKNIKFPRVEIIPEKQEVTNEIIGDDYNFWDLSIRLLPFVKSYAKEDATLELLKITGRLCDLVYEIRKRESHKGLFDDISIERIENYFFTGDNYVLYGASILLKFDVRF
jgi:hypothetical protein